MKEVIIVGTGGFAAELVEYIYDNNKYLGNQIKIKGYLDVDDINYNRYKFEEPFLGNEDIYKFEKNDLVYLAVGNDKIRKKIILKLKDKNLVFENFIHYSAIISKSSEIGFGNIIVPNVIIGPKTKIGNFNLINYNCCLAHDCILGNNNIFSPNVYITGYCCIGNENFFSLSTGLTPNIKVGNENKIQAGIIVNKNITDFNIVFSMDKIKYTPIYKSKN